MIQPPGNPGGLFYFKPTMKKPNAQNPSTIFSIYAEDKKGLLGQLLIYFNRKGYTVHSLNAARTDISDLVLITIEADVPAAELPPFTERLKKVIEVYAVHSLCLQGGLNKLAFFRLALPVMASAQWQAILQYGATISSITGDTLVITKAGSDDLLSKLYAALEGPYLQAFCKSPLIVEENLVPFDAL